MNYLCENYLKFFIRKNYKALKQFVSTIKETILNKLVEST